MKVYCGIAVCLLVSLVFSTVNSEMTESEDGRLNPDLADENGGENSGDRFTSQCWRIFVREDPFQEGSSLPCPDKNECPSLEINYFGKACAIIQCNITTIITMSAVINFFMSKYNIEDLTSFYLTVCSWKSA